MQENNIHEANGLYPEIQKGGTRRLTMTLTSKN